MLKDIVEVHPLTNYQLKLRFEDGVEGIIDLSKLVQFTGVFEPLKNPDYFNQVKLSSEWGTVYWDSGADLDPDVLYSHLSQEPIQLKTTSIY